MSFQYFLNQKFLDCSLLVEGKHLVECHRFVLDACSDYFASFLKNKALDDKNLVICLPNEIKLWEVQALLQFMYHGEVCISQEGLSSLVKCAELLKVKGLCGNDTTSIISKDKESSPKPKTKATEDVEDSAMECENSNSISEMIETDTNASDCCDQIIKRELCISENRVHVMFILLFIALPILGDVEPSSPSDERLHQTPSKSTAQGLIRVKRNLFESNDKESPKNQNGGEEASNSLVYNKKSMDIYVKPNETEEEVRSSGSTPQPAENDQEFENIVCSPALMQYHYMTDNIKNSSSQSEDASANKAESLEEYDDDDDDDLFIEEANVCSNDALYNMITQKFGDCDTFSNISGNDSELKRNLMISSVGSLSQYNGSDMASVDAQTAEANEMKMAIGGLYLRNPRGRQ